MEERVNNCSGHSFFGAKQVRLETGRRKQTVQKQTAAFEAEAQWAEMANKQIKYLLKLGKPLPPFSAALLLALFNAFAPLCSE